jgi:hypothetical protein
MKCERLYARVKRMDAKESGTRLRTRSTKNMCESPLANVLEESMQGEVMWLPYQESIAYSMCIVCCFRLLLQHAPSAKAAYAHCVLKLVERCGGKPFVKASAT